MVRVSGTGVGVRGFAVRVLGFRGSAFPGFGYGFLRFRVSGAVFYGLGFRVWVFLVWGWGFGPIEVRGFGYGVS